MFASNPESQDGNDNYDGSLISPRTATTYFMVEACAEVRVALGRNPMVIMQIFLLFSALSIAVGSFLLLN